MTTAEKRVSNRYKNLKFLKNGHITFSVFKAISIALVLSVAAYLGSGLRYAFYSPVRSSIYLWAVYHVHSTMSDGLGSPEEIALQAHTAGVSLVLLTDHGNPNLAATTFHRLINGVTLVGGSEARLPDGRLTFFGATDLPRYSISSFPPDAMNDARGWGAFPVIAYPDDPLYGWNYWKTDIAPGGIEVSNLFTCVRGLSVADKLLLVLFYPFSRFYFLKSISFPANSLAHWDGFLQMGKTWGLIAADAHGGFRIGKWGSVSTPSYNDMFSFAGLGYDRKYASQPEQAIRQGDFFNCIRGAGEPLLFEFSAIYHQAKFVTGSNVPEGSDLHIQVQTSNQAVHLALKKNGNILRSVDGGELSIPNADTGVYRVEVYLRNHLLLPPDVPWIMSNPIFVGDTRSAPVHKARLNSQAVAGSTWIVPRASLHAHSLDSKR